ncbi:MAG: hypothetical protein C4325_04915 [Blastocatellia bacterium]
MNVFADLIEELKEENLLEETIIDLKRRAAEANDLKLNGSSAKNAAQTVEVEPETELYQVAESEAAKPGNEQIDEREFYRRRAMEEVSSLQMVEHVISGIEREYMKINPAVYDDLIIKKALHRFLQVSGEINSPEYSEAEYSLMHEAQSWFSALGRRDVNISVANLRRYCENSRPVLSSQALMALGRFYRNSPFSEPARGKFDFVMTRLFSRELEGQRRKLLFSRPEMIGHIRTLYGNWSSLSLYPRDEYSDGIGAVVGRFDAFVKEVEGVENFAELIESDFFNRLRLFKEETGELFFASEVLAAAIECNVRVGNRFVDLLEAEREQNDIESIEKKYGYSYDTIISNAASKTLFLVELLKGEKLPAPEMVPQAPLAKPITIELDAAHEVTKPRAGVNKWLLAATVLTAVISIGIYFWSSAERPERSGVQEATTIELPAGNLQTHIRFARRSDETLYGIAQPTWIGLSAAEQREMLSEALAFAHSIGLKRVNILNEKGRTIGYATKDKIEVVRP